MTKLQRWTGKGTAFKIWRDVQEYVENYTTENPHEMESVWFKKWYGYYHTMKIGEDSISHQVAALVITGNPEATIYECIKTLFSLIPNLQHHLTIQEIGKVNGNVRYFTNEYGFKTPTQTASPSTIQNKKIEEIQPPETKNRFDILQDDDEHAELMDDRSPEVNSTVDRPNDETNNDKKVDSTDYHSPKENSPAARPNDAITTKNNDNKVTSTEKSTSACPNDVTSPKDDGDKVDTTDSCSQEEITQKPSYKSKVLMDSTVSRETKTTDTITFATESKVEPSSLHSSSNEPKTTTFNAALSNPNLSKVESSISTSRERKNANDSTNALSLLSSPPVPSIDKRPATPALKNNVIDENLDTSGLPSFQASNVSVNPSVTSRERVFASLASKNHASNTNLDASDTNVPIQCPIPDHRVSNEDFTASSAPTTSKVLDTTLASFPTSCTTNPVMNTNSVNTPVKIPNVVNTTTNPLVPSILVGKSPSSVPNYILCLQCNQLHQDSIPCPRCYPSPTTSSSQKSSPGQCEGCGAMGPIGNLCPSCEDTGHIFTTVSTSSNSTSSASPYPSPMVKVSDNQQHLVPLSDDESFHFNLLKTKIIKKHFSPKTFIDLLNPDNFKNPLDHLDQYLIKMKFVFSTISNRESQRMIHWFLHLVLKKNLTRVFPTSRQQFGTVMLIPLN